MSTEVVMPQMGESIAEGTITKWLKKVGDRVERDEPLFEISTDKVDAEIPSPAAGTLTEIKFNEGDTVEVNKVVAVLDGDSSGTSAQPAAETAQATQQETVPKAATEETPKSEPPPPPSRPQNQSLHLSNHARPRHRSHRRQPALLPKHQHLRLSLRMERAISHLVLKTCDAQNPVPWSVRLLRNTASTSRNSKGPE